MYEKELEKIHKLSISYWYGSQSKRKEPSEDEYNLLGSVIGFLRDAKRRLKKRRW